MCRFQYGTKKEVRPTCCWLAHPGQGVYGPLELAISDQGFACKQFACNISRIKHAAPKCAHLQEKSTTQLFIEGLDDDGGSGVSHAATEFSVRVATLIVVGDSPLLLLPAVVADACSETRVGISM